MVFNADGSSVTTIKDSNGNEKEIEAKYVIDSSGYGRVLPRILDLDIPSTLPRHSSIFTQVKDVRRPKGQEGTLISFDILETEVWLWVIPFSNGNTSIGLVGPTEFINSFEGTPAERLNKMLQLSDYYKDRFLDLEEEYLFEPIIIQNFSKAVKQLYGKGYALTGNSSEFLDPIFSSGVTFATETGLLCFMSKQDAEKPYIEYLLNFICIVVTYSLHLQCERYRYYRRMS